MIKPSSLDDRFFGPFSPRARHERARARELRACKAAQQTISRAIATSGVSAATVTTAAPRARSFRRQALFGHFATVSRWSIQRSQRSSAFRSGYVPVFFSLFFAVALLARGHDTWVALAVLLLGGSALASRVFNIAPSLSSLGSQSFANSGSHDSSASLRAAQEPSALRPGKRARALAIAVFALAAMGVVASLFALDPAGF